MFTIPIVEISD